VNTSATAAMEAEIDVRGGRGEAATVTELTHKDIHAHNTFDAPRTVRPRRSTEEFGRKKWRHTFPPASVTVCSMKL
jgi:alpha-L-arabinofuranosidase